MKNGFITILVSIPMMVFSQSRLIINDNAYVVITNSVYLVIDNSNANAITTMGSGGNIISENEDNIIRWNVGNSTGAYIVPFCTTPASQGGNGTKIPFEMDISVTGVGTGYFDFSTYETTTDMNGPWATGVTHMNSSPGVDNSLFVADRFWMVEANNYTTNPTTQLYFNYDDAINEIGGTNSLLEANLQAQSWNSAVLNWTDPIGTVNAGTNRMEGVSLTPTELNSIWVLVDKSSPLPIDNISLQLECINEGVLLSWEVNKGKKLQNFTIEYSDDGVVFHRLAGIENNNLNNYEYIDDDKEHVTYYRLKYLNKGKEEYSSIVANICETPNELKIISYRNDANQLQIIVSATKSEEHTLSLIDMSGRIVVSEKHRLEEGINLVNLNSPIAQGIYVLQAFNDSEVSVKKIRLIK